MEEKRKKIILWLLVLLCASFVVGSTIFLAVKLNPEIVKNVSLEKKENISGKIYLSLVPASNSEMNNEIYYYDIEGRKLGKFFQTENVETNYLAGVFSPDGKNVAFATSSNMENTKGQGQIFIADKNGLNQRQITNSAGLHKRNLRWSPDGKKIAFQHLGDKKISSAGILYGLENWNINVTDLEGKEVFIAKGSFPHFLPDGRLLVLKNDGFYIFNSDGKDEGKRLWAAVDNGGNFNSSMQFSVSRDGKYIVWTVPFDGKIIVMKISSFEPLSVDEIREINRTAYWPVFSKDGRHFIVEETDENNENPKLILYNIENLNFEKLFDLEGYEQSSMFISDWN